MSCSLCFEGGDEDQLINISSDEAQSLNVPTILYTHFRFCFEVK